MCAAPTIHDTVYSTCWRPCLAASCFGLGFTARPARRDLGDSVSEAREPILYADTFTGASPAERALCLSYRGGAVAPKAFVYVVSLKPRHAA